LDERAFNLFTALLAMILIILTSVLVISMVQSESNTKTIISKLISQSKMESMARLIRADAFQTFNYAMREQIEWWLSRPDNQFVIDGDYRVWEDWDKVIDEFANSRFKNHTAFAKFLGENMPSQLISYDDDYTAGYKISVDFDTEKFVPVLQQVVMDSAAERDFFEVVDCDGTPAGCPNGSFYIKLKFSELAPEVYESMPLVTVTDVRSCKGSTDLHDPYCGRELKDPVLPRNDIKIFVPLRIFRALAITRAFMHSELGPGMNGADDFGFYAPRIHNEFDSMALGMCDYGYCRPRDNPYFPPEEQHIQGHKCPGFLASKMDVRGSFRGEPFDYTAGNKRNTEEALKNLVEKRLCALSRDLIAPHDSPGDFEIVSETEAGGTQQCYLSVEKIEIGSSPSKLIELGKGVKPAPRPFPLDEPNHSDMVCPFDFTLSTGGQHRKIGMYKDASGTAMPDINAAVCKGFHSMLEEEDRQGRSNFVTSCEISAGGKSWACCSEVATISLVLTFEEKDQHYKVNKDRDVRFNIKTFNKGYSPFNPNFDFGLGDSSCALDSSLSRSDSCDKSGWKCVVPDNFDDACYPAA